MSRIFGKVLAFGLAMVVAAPAYALIEVRGALGGNFGNADASTVTIGGEELPVVPAALAFSADAIFHIPLMPVGFGARYESFGVSHSDDLDIALSISRASFLVNYRLIDTLIYVGPIATIGLAHSNSLKVSGIPGESDRTYTGEMDAFSTYSIGVEFGFNLIGFIVGAEVGQMAMNMKNPKTSGGERLGTDLDFTGIYGKIMVGIGF